MKIILFFPFNLLSHYLRCITLAENYDRNSYKVIFLASDKYDKYVKEAGYETFSGENFNEIEVMECATRFSFKWLNEAAMEKILLNQIAIINNYSPETVIGDMAPTLKMAASYTGVQYISLLNGYMTNYYARPRHLPKSHPISVLLKVFPDKIGNKMARFGEHLAFKWIHRPFKNLRAKYKLPYIANYLTELEGEQTLICDVPELFPQRNLPIHFSFIGPLIYQDKSDESPWLNRLPARKAVICAAMGSTGNWEKLRFLNDPFYQKYTIITAGDQKCVINGNHVIRKDFLNLAQVLRRTDLLICHGGNGTIYMGIEVGVKMFCLTNHFEQEWNVGMLEEHQLGKLANHFTVGQWQTEVEIVMSQRESEIS